MANTQFGPFLFALGERESIPTDSKPMFSGTKELYWGWLLQAHQLLGSGLDLQWRWRKEFVDHCPAKRVSKGAMFQRIKILFGFLSSDHFGKSELCPGSSHFGGTG